MITLPNGRISARACLFQLPSIFVLIALLVGTALVVITPPFQTADEPQHFWRAWQISRGEFISRHASPQGEQGAYLPRSLLMFYARFLPLVSRPDRKITPRHVLDLLHISLDPDQQSFLTFGNTALYFPVGYFPQSLGIMLGRLFLLPLPVIFYLSRECNLLAFAFLGYLSLRAAPALARPMFLLLLTPTMLSRAATLSGETLTNVLAALFVSLVCRYFAKGAGSVDRKALLAFYLVSIPLSAGKFVYAPLILMLFLIPAENFGGSSKKIARMAFLIGINLLVLGIWISATSSLGTMITEDRRVSPPRQLAYLQQYPDRIPGLLWNTAKVASWYLCQTYVAVIGWLDAFFPTPVVIAWLLLACWTADDRPPAPGGTKNNLSGRSLDHPFDARQLAARLHLLDARRPLRNQRLAGSIFLPTYASIFPDRNHDRAKAPPSGAISAAR